MITHRPALDVSRLPDVVFGHKSPIWWGTMGMIVIEGFFFAQMLVIYFYLRTRVNDWPPGILPPDLAWGTLNTFLFLATMVPNFWLKKAAEKGDLQKARIGLLIMSGVAVFVLLIRIGEFLALNCRWDANAYASTVWVLLGLHTVHVLTDAADTWVLTALMFTDKVEGKRFMDVSENADYWTFVVLTWLPIYAVLYFAPRAL